MVSQEKLLKSIELILQDFSPDDDANENWKNPAAETRINIPYEITPLPYLVFIMFVHIKEYSFGGQWEKVNWEIPVKYKNIPLMLSHRKFGFRISSPKGKDADNRLVIEAIHKINKASPIAEKLVEPYIKELVDNGKINVPNEYLQLRDRYQYFRENAEKYYSEADKRRKTKNIENNYSSYNEIVRSGYIASHNFTAMLDAYFSYLEHILVLVKPFIHLDVVESNLSAYIGMLWSEKYKTIFDINTDIIAKKHYDALYDIKESYRNVLSHGNFQKGGGSISVHMKHLGAIPMHLSRSKDSLRYGFGKMQQKNFEEVCEVFDSFDEFLELGETKYGIKFAKSGCYLPFDSESKNMYKNAMESDKEFDNFLEYFSRMQDDAANMDW